MTTNNGMSGISKESLFEAYGTAKRRLATVKERNREQLAKATAVGGNVVGGLVAGAVEQRLRDKKTGQARTVMGVGIPLLIGSAATGLGMARQVGKFSPLAMALGGGMLAYGVGNVTKDRMQATQAAKARKAQQQQAGGGAVPAGGGSAVVAGAMPAAAGHPYAGHHAHVAVGAVPAPRAMAPVAPREITLDDLQRQWAQLRSAYDY